MEKTVYDSEGELHSSDTAVLKIGHYFLEVISDQGRTVKKIVKK
jgi:hypothetical protein